MAFHFEASGRSPDKDSAQLIQFLLDEKTTLRDLRPLLHSSCESSQAVDLCAGPPGGIIVQAACATSSPFSAELLWQRDLQKCIDASPVLLYQKYASDVARVLVDRSRYVCIGSHSGLFVACSLQDGKSVFEVERHARIEATCAVYGDFVAFGKTGIHSRVTLETLR